MVINTFQVEKKRHELAKKGDHSLLVELYSRKHPELEDRNSPALWDKLNVVNVNLKKENPMAYDKYKRVINMLSHGRVLNVGVGSGYLEDCLFSKKQKLEWYGIDISERSISRMKKKYPHATFLKREILKTSFPRDYFDCVVALDVLEHIQPKKIFMTLKELKRMLKKDGQLIISVPLNERLEEMVKEGENPNAHLRVYTPEIIKAELEISGFKIDSKEYLYAFNSFYTIKSIICRYFKNLREPNLIILCVSAR